MRPTLEFLTNRFAYFNATIFNGSLPTPRLVINNNRSRLGQLAYRIKRDSGRETCYNFVLSLSQRFERDETIWEDTVIHEMIHLQIQSQGYNDTSAHGKIFRAIMDKINNTYHRHITVAGHMTQSERLSDKTVRQHYVCVVHLNDGRIGIACVAQSRFYYFFHNITPIFDNCKSIDWYQSKDPYFNRYRRVIKPGRLYIVDNIFELESILSNAIQLRLINDKLRAFLPEPVKL